MHYLINKVKDKIKLSFSTNYIISLFLMYVHTQKWMLKLLYIGGDINEKN